MAQFKDGQWFARSVNRLTRYGHKLQEIGDYTFDQFLWHLNAVDADESRVRLQTIADMQLVITSALTEESGLADHLDDLRLAARGA